jgi:hypothetical protein
VARERLTAARPQRACLHSCGQRRVADERGPAGSGRAQGREAWGMLGPAEEGNGVGRAQRKREVGRAQMNNDDF